MLSPSVFPDRRGDGAEGVFVVVVGVVAMLGVVLGVVVAQTVLLVLGCGGADSIGGCGGADGVVGVGGCGGADSVVSVVGFGGADGVVAGGVGSRGCADGAVGGCRWWCWGF